LTVINALNVARRLNLIVAILLAGTNGRYESKPDHPLARALNAISIALHDKLASRDHDPDAVVPAMSAAFLIVLTLWGAFFALTNF
jgi:hypothetical protein